MGFQDSTQHNLFQHLYHLKIEEGKKQDKFVVPKYFKTIAIIMHLLSHTAAISKSF